MRARELVCNQQTAFLQALFKEGARVDRRAWTENRAVKIEFLKKSGVIIVSLGDTKVMCTVETEITAPRKNNRPGSGSIQFSLEILTMAHPSSSDSSLDNEVEECLTMLETLYRDTYCIDFETLCIERYQYVFDLKVSLRVIDYAGGIFDCCALAVTTALMGFKRNDATYDGVAKKLVVHPPEEKPMVPLTLYYKPATITFGFIPGIVDPIVDPSDTEAALIEGYLVIGANHRGEICLMHQKGNLDISKEMITRCSDFAISHSKRLTEQMDKAISS